MTVYLSGKIIGNPDYKLDFDIAQESIEFGDFKEAGLDPDECTYFVPSRLPEGKTAVEYMRICFAMIELADVVAMLPNWSDSRGATLERDYADYIGKKIIYM